MGVILKRLMLPCFLTMILSLAPLGADSSYDHLRITEGCQSLHTHPIINRYSELILTTPMTRYVIPLPRREDSVRLSYKMRDEYAYLGDCAYGYAAYHYFDSVCQKVVVRFGPNDVY